jgi:hypothetical protein
MKPTYWSVAGSVFWMDGQLHQIPVFGGRIQNLMSRSFSSLPKGSTFLVETNSEAFIGITRGSKYFVKF